MCIWRMHECVCACLLRVACECVNARVFDMYVSVSVCARTRVFLCVRVNAFVCGHGHAQRKGAVQ